MVIFGGGVPVKSQGSVIGAVGASAGTIEQDIAVAEAAVDAFDRAMRSPRPPAAKVCD